MLHYFQEECKSVAAGRIKCRLNFLVEVNNFFKWILILGHIISINGSCTSACDLKRSVGCKIALDVCTLLQLYVFIYALNFSKD